MKDNEIIKALECCIEVECDECPFDEQTSCTEYVKQGALDLINRQKAEVERLEEESSRNFKALNNIVRRNGG